MKMHHEFVSFIPETLNAGTLYISMEYKTAAHLCACGCGNEVHTPISPTDWKMTYDGDSVSLNPSIGNWDFPCRSHYFITRGKVCWAGNFTDEQITAVKEEDRRLKKAYYGKGDDELKEEVKPKPKGFFFRLFSLFR